MRHWRQPVSTTAGRQRRIQKPHQRRRAARERHPFQCKHAKTERGTSRRDQFANRHRPRHSRCLRGSISRPDAKQKAQQGRIDERQRREVTACVTALILRQPDDREATASAVAHDSQAYRAEIRDRNEPSRSAGEAAHRPRACERPPSKAERTSKRRRGAAWLMNRSSTASMRHRRQPVSTTAGRQRRIQKPHRRRRAARERHPFQCKHAKTERGTSRRDQFANRHRPRHSRCLRGSISRPDAKQKAQQGRIDERQRREVTACVTALILRQPDDREATASAVAHDSQAYRAEIRDRNEPSRSAGEAAHRPRACERPPSKAERTSKRRRGAAWLMNRSSTASMRHRRQPVSTTAGRQRRIQKPHRRRRAARERHPFQCEHAKTERGNIAQPHAAGVPEREDITQLHALQAGFREVKPPCYTLLTNKCATQIQGFLVPQVAAHFRDHLRFCQWPESKLLFMRINERLIMAQGFIGCVIKCHSVFPLLPHEYF